MNNKKITEWQPKEFELQHKSVWSFPERGSWATHDSKYRGNWSPYVPRNIILRYSKEKDLILDQFAGGGTTLIEAKLLNRNIIGVDINPAAIDTCRLKTNFEYENSGEVYLHNADATSLDFIASNSIDLICTHPPYGDIIKYSDGIKGDISNLDIISFEVALKRVAGESYRVLKSGKYCAVLMGDTRKNGGIVPLSFKLMNIFINAGFSIKEIIIKEQHNCKYTDYWAERSVRYNFLLLAHEYLFVFKK